MNIEEALEKMADPTLEDSVKWAALAYALREMCVGAGADLNYDREKD